MERAQPDPAVELLAKTVFPFIFVGIFVVSAVLIPSVRFAFVDRVLALREIEARVFAPEELPEIVGLRREVRSLGPEGLTPGLAGRALVLSVRLSRKAAVRAGFALSVFLAVVFGGLILLVRRKGRSLSAREAIERYRRASLSEVLEQYGLSELPSDPVRAARVFAEARKKRNIPPNVIARKLVERNPVLAAAIWWWPRVCEKEIPEVMWPVEKPEELSEFLKKSVAAASGEPDKERVEALKKKVEAAFRAMTEGSGSPY